MGSSHPPRPWIAVRAARCPATSLRRAPQQAPTALPAERPAQPITGRQPPLEGTCGVGGANTKQRPVLCHFAVGSDTHCLSPRPTGPLQLISVPFDASSGLGPATHSLDLHFAGKQFELPANGRFKKPAAIPSPLLFEKGGGGQDGNVEADSTLSDKFKGDWTSEFGWVYSASLSKRSPETSVRVQTEGWQSFEFQTLLHSYFKVEDISKIRVQNLQSKTYVDKVRNAEIFTESSPALAVEGEVDRVYQSLDPKVPIVIASESDKPIFSITRESLNDVVVWNPWIEKAKGMADFAPDEAYKNMICVEAGSVVGWQTLEPGDTWEGGQTIECKL
ncbi:aldose 1-epimerase family protein [Coccidioides immitis H538.4]|uniref:Aldose 1-epimerase family protein n=1 Tax=Coccidioides immitis H538.4 TaxID=396776 RepID=A0A0J8UAW4_COCIT|nr:aldose 1-epimerase family protein [Coccidioides immitis H538.4]